MNGHIRILVGGREAILPDDFALDMEWVNPLFNDNVESGSLPFNIPLEGNRRFVKNIEDVKSGMRAMDVEHTPCVVYVDDVPYHSGELVVSEDQELKDSLDASINSYIRSLDDLISDLDCQDVPVKDKIQIGECIGDLVADYEFEVQVFSKMTSMGFYSEDEYVKPAKIEQTFPAVGFSVPVEFKEKDAQHILVETDDGKKVIKENFVNTSDAYPDAKYCNARVCYPRKKLNSDGTTGSDVDLSAPLYVLEAKRPGSGVCFYLLYFFDCLFKYLGLSYDSSKLLTVEDMKRLAFYTTHCEYDTERKYPLTQAEVNNNTERYDLNSVADINLWLSERSDGEDIGTSELKEAEWTTKKFDFGFFYYNYLSMKNLSKAEFVFKGTTSSEMNQILYRRGAAGKKMYVMKGGILTCEDPTVLEGYNFKCDEIYSFVFEKSGTLRANIMKMYANSKNFPETSVKNIIDSMWASFGVKFVLDYEKKSVKAYMIRDVLRSRVPRTLHGKILSVHKKVEKTTGFRMRYAAESDPKNQSKNVRDGVRDYETAFDYLMSASPIVYENADGTPVAYVDLANSEGGISDINCYVDRATGNAYRWKVDKEAKTVADAKVNLFEVASYKGISRGDCSKKNEDYIVDVTSNFEPVVFSDVSMMDADKEPENVFAAFADEDMLNEKDTCKFTIALGSSLVDYPVDAEIKTKEKWDPSSSEECDSPLQNYDWGTSVAVMRGGGTDAAIQYYDYNYDGFGNAKYRTVSGKYAFTSDSIDSYGNEYDYNASDPGIGNGERFSLKITAYKHDEQGNPLTDDQGNILCDDDVRDSQTGEIVKKIRSRGLFDTFMSEYCQFLLNRTPLVIKMLCEVAELVDIPNHWDEKWEIGEYVGWINKVKTHTTMVAGLEEVEVEMYSL